MSLAADPDTKNRRSRPPKAALTQAILSASRLFAVIRMEIAFTLRRPLFWTWIALIALMSWGSSTGDLSLLPSGDSAVGGKKAWVSSEFAVAAAAGIVALLFHTFFITVIVGLSIIRDEENRVGDILHATPLSSGEYIWGKFGGALSSVSIALLLQTALMIFFNHLLPHNTSPELRGPFAARHYFLPLLIFSVPLAVFLAGTAFAIGERTRRAILIFFLPVALLLLNILFLSRTSANSGLSPWVRHAIILMDPTGFGWFNHTYLLEDRGVDFYNTGNIALDAPFLVSRLLLIALGLGAVAASRVGFQRSLRQAGRSPRRAKKASVGKVAAKSALEAPPVTIPALSALRPAQPLSALAMRVRPPGLFRSVLPLAYAELRELATQPGLYLFIPLIVFFIVVSALDSTGMLDTPLLLTAGSMAVSQMQTLPLFTCILLLVYTVEALERDRNVAFSAIRNALPLRTASFLMGKFLALNAIIFAVQGACLAASLIALAHQGSVPVTPVPFLLVGGLLLPTFWMWIASIMAAYAVGGGRSGAYITGLLGLVVFFAGGQGLTWVGNLFLSNALHCSDLSILEADRPALLWNRLLTLSLILFYGAVAVRFWPRRERDPARLVTRIRPLSLLRAGAVLVPFATLPIGIAWSLHQDIANGFEGEIVNKSEKDYWRQNVNTWQDAALPGLKTADIAINLEPAQRRFTVRGTYLLVNTQAKPLTEIPLTCGFLWNHLTWTLDGKPYTPNDHSGLYIVIPPTPLPPGGTLRLGFSFSSPNPGISRSGGDVSEFVLPSAVVLTSFDASFVPQIGYNSDIGVDEDNRAEPKVIPLDFYHGLRPPRFGMPTPFMLRLQVTTPQDFSVNSVGDIIQDTVHGNLRTLVWQSAHPIWDFNIVGGYWRVRRTAGTAVFYHPGHGVNVPEMLSALTAARRYYSRWYAPYPDRELKLSEFPALAGYAQSFPTNITFGEDMGFLTKSRTRENAAFAVTAHEAAHQWWGQMVVPGKGPGGNVLSEGMAQCSASFLLNRVKGTEARNGFLREIETEYLKARRVDSERALVETSGTKDGEEAVTYEKGGWAFLMLAQEMGWSRAEAGFQRFLATYRNNPNHPVLQDFFAVMRPYAPDKSGFDDLVQQLFFQVVLPEYHLDHVRRTPESIHGVAGWKVTARLTNTGTGRFPITVGAWGKTADDTPSPDFSGTTTATVGPSASSDIIIHCHIKPTTVAVDPNVNVLQQNREAAFAFL
jgi:ABC-2 type transport system permease protein